MEGESPEVLVMGNDQPALRSRPPQDYVIWCRSHGFFDHTTS
jgi:hypothetical protein